MGEEGEDIKAIAEPEAEAEGEKEEQKYREENYIRPKCNMRIEELAKPNKMSVKITYKKYKKVLPERNIRAIITFLREEFAKSSEETEVDFKKLEHKFNLKRCKNICRKEAKKDHLQKLNENRRKNMLKILTEILKQFMTKAYFNPKHIIMTNRLRRVSNVVLRELCKIRGIPVPKRDSKNIRASLMFSVSDFFAYCIDVIYYEMQVQKVSDYEQILQLIEIEGPKTEVEIENSKK